MASGSEYNLLIKIAGAVDSSLKQSAANASNLFGSIVKASLVTDAIKAVGAAAKDFVTSAVDTYTDFQQSMANTSAISGATADEYERLEEAARAAGKTTSFTATEAADALGYMSLAGWDVNTSTQALTPVLQLAEATQADLATTSDQVTDSMSAMGVGVDELNGYLDVIVATNNNANTSASSLMEAFIGVGGAAQAAGMSYTETATALGILANNGIKGSEAGTALNSMLVRMTSKDTAIKAMKDLGVAVYDSSGNMRDFKDVLVDVNGAMDGMTESEKNAYMSKIAGTNYYTDFQYLLQGVAEGADGAASSWDDLTQSLENSGGALQTMDDTVMNTVSGSWATLQSAVDDAKLSFMDAFGPDIQEVLTYLAETVMPMVSQACADIGEWLSGTAIPAIQDFCGWMSDTFGPVIGPIMDAFSGEILPAASQALEDLGAWITGTAAPAIQQFVWYVSDANGLTADFTNFLTENKTALEVAAIAIGALGLAILAYNAPAIAATVSSALQTAGIWLYCAATDAATFATGALSAVVGFLTSPFTIVIGVIAAVIAIGALLSNNWDALSAKGQEIVASLCTAFPWFSSVFTGVGEAIGQVAEGIKKIFDGLVQFVSSVFAGDWSSAWEGIVEVFGGIWEGLVGLVKMPINAVIGLVNSAISALNSISVTIPDWVPGIGGSHFGLSIPSIPMLAKGGIATGPTLAEIGEGSEPEAVLPLSKLESLLSDGVGGDTTSEIVFSPQIIIQGNASEADVSSAVGSAFEQFKQFMAQYEHEKRRKVFA